MNQAEWDKMVDQLAEKAKVPRWAAAAVLRDVQPASREREVQLLVEKTGCSVAVAEDIIPDWRAQEAAKAAKAKPAKPEVVLRYTGKAAPPAKTPTTTLSETPAPGRLARPAAANKGNGPLVELREYGPGGNMGSIIRTKGGKR